jgi:hypothetical protein
MSCVQYLAHFRWWAILCSATLAIPIAAPADAQSEFDEPVIDIQDGDAQVVFDPALSAFHLISDDPIEHSHFTADFGPFDFIEYEYSRVGNLDVGLSISETGLTQFGFAISWNTFNPATLLGGLLVAPVSDGPAPHPDPQTGVEGRYIVTIFIDQPTVGSPNIWSGAAGDDVCGHVFLQLRDAENDECVTVGFGPAGVAGLTNRPEPGFRDVWPTLPSVPGLVSDDSESNWDIRRSWVIDANRYNRLRHRIHLDQSRPPRYRVDNYNCAGWAIEMLKFIDIDINLTNPYYDGATRRWFIHAPGPLGTDMLHNDGERRMR